MFFTCPPYLLALRVPLYGACYDAVKLDAVKLAMRQPSITLHRPLTRTCDNSVAIESFVRTTKSYSTSQAGKNQ